MDAGHRREARRAWKRLDTWLDEKVTGPGSRDREPEPLTALGDVGMVRRLLDEVELRAVRSARLRGRSWAEIATRLGVTRQSAWEKWRDLDDTAADFAEIVTAESPMAAEREGEFGRVCIVPNVVGCSVSAACRELGDRGLVPVASDPEMCLDMAPTGAIVTDQSPEAGAKVPPESLVLLWIDRGEGGVREPRRPLPEPLPARKYLPDPADEAVG